MVKVGKGSETFDVAFVAKASVFPKGVQNKQKVIRLIHPNTLYNHVLITRKACTLNEGFKTLSNHS